MIRANAINARIMHGIQEPCIVAVIFITGNLNVPTIIPIKNAIVANSSRALKILKSLLLHLYQIQKSQLDF